MARKPRLEYEGAIYHVMSRGNRQEAIFLDDRDRRVFLETLGQACEKAGWEVHAYCMMGNHFHIVLETPRPTLVAGMKWLLSTFTLRFNARHRMRGHLFSGRYKALVVDGSDDFYMRVVCDYVHLNPVRAGLIEKGHELSDYEWSSYPEYLKTPGKRVKWLRVDRLFGELGINGDRAFGRREFKEYMEMRSSERENPDDDHWQGIRRGWRFGADDFLERLIEMGATEKVNARIHGGGVVAETMEESARRMIGEYLGKRKISLQELISRPKGDSQKVLLAAELRRRTTMTVAWIAKELNAGAPQTLWSALRGVRTAFKGDNTRD